MAKRELSNTLRNLKFMQRAAHREEQPKKEEEVKPDGNFISSVTVNRKCVVIMAGDPHPGTLKGRMSFQSFNPTIDKLNEDLVSSCQQEIPTSSSGNHSENFTSRENGSSRHEADCSNIDKQSNETNGDLKRKQPELVYEAQHPTKFINRKGSFKKTKGEKLDFNVLRPSKNPNKSG